MTTEQQKQNLRRIWARAKSIMAEQQRAAVKAGDFDTSLNIADFETTIESTLREQYAVEVAVKHTGADWVMLR